MVNNCLHHNDKALPSILPTKGIYVYIVKGSDLFSTLVNVETVSPLDQIVIRGVCASILFSTANRKDAQFFHQSRLTIDLFLCIVAKGMPLPLGGQILEFLFLSGKELVWIICAGVCIFNLV